jgi:hypothetical protein
MDSYSLANDIANKLITDGIISKSQKDSVRHSMMDFWEDYAAILWRLEDVHDEAESMDVKLSNDEARVVLSSVNKYADCEYGITLETIGYHTREYIKNRT